MSHNGHDAYLEGRVLSADPLELVRMLYQGAINAVRRARQCLIGGDIAGRGRAITNAYEIVAELSGALDRSGGGEIAERLARLYDYVQRRLIDAHIQQSDGPLAEVLGLLTALADAWQGAQPQSAAPQPASSAWVGVQAAETEPLAHAWSA